MPSLETCSTGTMGSSNKWKPGDTPELGILHAPLGYPLPGLKNKTQSQDSRKTGQEYFPSVQVPSGRHFSLFPLTKATFPRPVFAGGTGRHMFKQSCLQRATDVRACRVPSFPGAHCSAVLYREGSSRGDLGHSKSFL